MIGRQLNRLAKNKGVLKYAAGLAQGNLRNNGTHCFLATKFSWAESGMGKIAKQMHLSEYKISV